MSAGFSDEMILNVQTVTFNLCWYHEHHSGKYSWTKTCSRMHQNEPFRRRTWQNFYGPPQAPPCRCFYSSAFSTWPSDHISGYRPEHRPITLVVVKKLQHIYIFWTDGLGTTWPSVQIFTWSTPTSNSSYNHTQYSTVTLRVINRRMLPL